MSSIKPTGYPEWASASSASGIAEPTDAKKFLGWATSEKPAAQYMNWLQEKESAWLRYLSYDWVIDDHFANGNGVNVIPPAGAAGGTGLNPWSVAIGGDRIAGANEGGNGPIPAARLALGAVAFFQTGGSGLSRITRDAGSPHSRDVMLETIMTVATRGSGMALKIGVVRGGVNGCDMWFGTTGPSAPWYFNYGPAESYTSINMGIDPFSPSAYHTFIAERRGATLTVEANGQRVIVIPGGSVTEGSTHSFRQLQATIELTNGVSGGSPGWLIDRYRFGVR